MRDVMVNACIHVTWHDNLVSTIELRITQGERKIKRFTNPKASKSMISDHVIDINNKSIHTNIMSQNHHQPAEGKYTTNKELGTI